MNKKHSKSKDNDMGARSNTERDMCGIVRNPLENACHVLFAIAMLCFIFDHDGWGWIVLGLSIVPLVLFLICHVASIVLFRKTMKDFPYR